MSVAVIKPLSPAWDDMKRILFQPFDLVKWLGMALGAWLISLGQGPNPNNLNIQGDPDQFGRLLQDLRDSLHSMGGDAAVIGAVIGVIVLVLAFTAVMLWLASRGTFMLLDNVVHNNGAVTTPWTEFRELGNSLFGFQLIVTLVIYAVVAVFVTALVLLPGDMAIKAAVAIPVGLVILLALVAIQFLLHNFVTTAMYLRRIRVMQAWSVVRYELLASQPGAIFGYFLMMIPLGLAAGVYAILATCLTCCLAALPYLNAVATLPVTVLFTAYRLRFIEQFGPQWQAFAYDRDRPVCPVCGYDLRGSLDQGLCPECGSPIPLEMTSSQPSDANDAYGAAPLEPWQTPAATEPEQPPPPPDDSNPYRPQ